MRCKICVPLLFITAVTAEAFDPKPYLDIASSAENYAQSVASAYKDYGESIASEKVSSASSIASYYESRAGDIPSSAESLASSYVREYEPHHHETTTVTETNPATTASAPSPQFTGAAMVVWPELTSVCLIASAWLVGTFAVLL